MNQEVKQKWLEALRSKRYTQGRGALRRGQAYCCLGVLCDAIDSSKWQQEHNIYNKDSYSYNRCTGTPPASVSKEAGLTPQQESLMVKYNDTDMLDFDEIADKIEQEF